MESLEIGMQWSTADISDERSSITHAPSPDRKARQLPFEVPRAGPNPVSTEEKDEASSSTLRVALQLEKDGSMTRGDSVRVTETEADVVTERKKGKSTTKRSMIHGQGENLLDRFGPPRQSIRARINMEFRAPPELPEEPTITISKKTKKTRRAKEISTSNPLRPAVSSKKKRSCDSDEASQGPGESRGNATGKNVTTKKKKCIAAVTHPSMELTEDDINADEIIAYQPGSLEAMGTSRVETSTKGDTLEQRLQGKKGKSRKTKSSTVKDDVEADTPLVQDRSLIEPSSSPVKPGIRSSTFRRVMRLVADLPPVEVKPKLKTRKVPDQRPFVWAMSRQELCEALPYYRAFQSGLYLSQGVAFGYLLDGFPAPRDACAHNARVIISHGGGHCVRPTLADGQVLPPVLAGDQLKTDFRVATLIRAMERRVPLVLLAGSGYELLPFKLNCSYAVLGWYWVSMVWTEAEPVAQGIKSPIGRDWYKRVKVRFDWVETQGKPWWEKTDEPALQRSSPSGEIERSIAVTSNLDVSAASTGSNAKPVHNIRYTAAGDDSHNGISSLHQEGVHVSADPLPSCQLGPADLNRNDQLLYPFNGMSGLMTPPITPPTAPSLKMPADETGTSSGVDPVVSEELGRRRLPGEYLMAPSVGPVQTQASVDPFIDMHRQCQSCPVSSPKVYAEGWVCLNDKCAAYWMLETAIGLLPVPPGLKLSYHPAFLAPAATPRDVRPPYDVVPPRPKNGIPDEAGPDVSAGSRSLWRGWVCESCGRANCRFRWEVWQCLGCQRLLAPIDPYSAVIPSHALVGTGKAMLGDAKIDTDSRISVTMRRIHDPAATVMVYTLPDRIGTIYHVINDCNDFADAIFDRYQREAASSRVPLFQRRPLNAHQIRGQLLAQHFAVNSGVSYKYNVDSLSLSFDESPSCVIQALEAIARRTERVVGTKIDFNEVLSVLYREGQKMSWHDDGEPGLGPVVAGLSMGSSAVISWRRKSAHSNANATFITGMPDPRKEATPPIALSLTTSHGDIVMMQGRDMQKKYVHRVIPNGFRVAATARVIGK